MRLSSSALLAVALASLTAGCGGSSRNDRHTTGSLSAPQTTRASTPSGPLKVVQVAQSSPFDPSAIYARDAPGVVTVISTFPAGGSGLAFVLFCSTLLTCAEIDPAHAADSAAPAGAVLLLESTPAGAPTPSRQ